MEGSGAGVETGATEVTGGGTGWQARCDRLFRIEAGGRMRGADLGRSKGALRIGVERAGRSRRWALPTMAFLVTPMRRPIAAVGWPAAHRARRVEMAWSFQSIPAVLEDIGAFFHGW